MLKKLTTNTVRMEKNEITERTAGICLPSVCLPFCGSRRDVYVDTAMSLSK